MKLSMKTFGLLALIGVLVATGVLYQFWNRALDSKDATQQSIDIESLRSTAYNAQKANLNTQIEDAKSELALAGTNLESLQNQFNQITSELDGAKGKFPSLADSIAYTEIFLEMARQSGVMLQNIQTSDAGITSISNNEYYFYGTDFLMDVNGELSQLMAFIDLITRSEDFLSGRYANMTFTLPEPVPPPVISQEEIDAIEAQLWLDMLEETEAGLTSYARIVFTGQAILEVLGAGSDKITTEEMTELIRQAISTNFGVLIANQFARELTEAIEEGLADSLIEIISTIYSSAISESFLAGDPQLSPEYGGILGEEITEALRDIPPSMVGSVVKELIETNINKVMAGYIENLTSREILAERVAEVVAAILADVEVTPPVEATISLTVFVYGDD